MTINKCCRCNKDQEGINNICGLPVCKEHSNWSKENVEVIAILLLNNKQYEEEQKEQMSSLW